MAFYFFLFLILLIIAVVWKVISMPVFQKKSYVSRNVIMSNDKCFACKTMPSASVCALSIFNELYRYEVQC